MSAVSAAGRLAGASGASTRKRLFILPYVAANGLLAVHAAVRLVAGEDVPTWLAALVAHAAAFGAVGVAPSIGAPVAARRIGPLLAVIAAATAVTAVRLPDDWEATAGVAVFALAGTVVYDRWYSRFGRRPSEGLAIGMPLPDVTLEDPARGTVSTADLVGRPAALFFFRGNWCPFCMAQVRAVADGYTRLAAAGVDVYLVSPQPDEETRALGERIGVSSLRFLRDPDLEAARRLGIVDRAGVPAGVRGFGADTVLPTLVVLDADGRVVLADQTDDYRVRPTPDTVLGALDAHRVEVA